MSNRKPDLSFNKQTNSNDLSDHQEILLKNDDEQEQDYISYLNSASEFVFPEDAPQFFNDVLLHFDNDYMTEKLGLEIFRIIRIFIKNPDFFLEFIKGDFLLQLPFGTTNLVFIDQILNVIYDVIQIDPTKINSPLGDENHFAKIVKKEPIKSLSLIKIFAEKCFTFKYDGTICPWALIDVLYYEIETFINGKNSETFKKYTSVLLYILEQYPIYRDNRLESYWNLFVVCLCNDIDSVKIQTAYNALCFFFDYFNSNSQNECNDKKKKRNNESFKYVAVIKGSDSKSDKAGIQHLPELPIDPILKHIRINSTTRNGVFKLLECYANVDPITLKNSKLLQYLIHYAKKSLNASLILMTLAKNESISQILSNYGNLWLDKGLPQAYDTLRLFTIVFQQENLREDLIFNSKFINFLYLVTEELNDEVSVGLVGLIISQDEITEEIMMKIRNEQFINTFLDIASQCESNAYLHSVLIFIYKATKFGIYSDFLPYIQWISNLKDEAELKETVSLVASGLAKNESCAKKMVSLRFNNFYEKQLNDPFSSETMKANSDKFLKRIQKSQRKE